MVVGQCGSWVGHWVWYNVCMGRSVWVGHWVWCLCGWVDVFMWVRWLWFVGVAMGVFVAMARVGFVVAGVNTVFCLPLICVLDPEKSKNVIFSP